MAKAADALIADATEHLRAVLPAPLHEVLLPALRLRLVGTRLVALVANLAWMEVFQAHAADPLREWTRSRGLELDAAARAGAEVEATTSMAQRFADFLRDPGNQLALTACRRVVEAPGLEHNPLYLHGPPGCGKSHLLSAVGAEFRHMLGEHAVVAFDGPSFVARDAQQLAERGSTPLRLSLSHAAVVVMDQVEALAGRTLAQEELFHLINSCLERGQQLVFASTDAPRKLPGFEDRLVTRLGWGLAVAIEPALAETRLGLLRRLAGPAAEGMEASELARLVDTLAPDMHQVARLAERLREGERVTVGTDMASFDRILQVVAEHYDLRPSDIAGKRRLREVAQARQMTLLLGRRLTAHSLVALGGMVGGRDHSTVLYSIRQAEERLAAEPDLQRAVGELTQKILGDDESRG
jgi:chromosomal replication initiator protein